MRSALPTGLACLLLVACSGSEPANDVAAESERAAEEARIAAEQVAEAADQAAIAADEVGPSEEAPATAPTAAGWPSDKACVFLPGLATRGWKNDYDNEYHCSSPYKDIGGDGPTGLPNNLAYYATGTGQTATRLKLVLNYNAPGNPAAATRELVSAAKTLATAATGASLPASIEKALRSGSASTEDAGDYAHEVKREDWPTGNGHEVHYILTRKTTG